MRCAVERRHYTDRPGLFALRVAIAEGLGKRFTVKFEAEDMMVTCGVTEARFVALQQLLGPGAVIAAPLHAEQLEGAALLRRAQLVTVVGYKCGAGLLGELGWGGGVPRGACSGPCRGGYSLRD